MRLKFDGRLGPILAAITLVTVGRAFAADPPSYLISTLAGRPMPPAAISGTLAAIGEPRAIAVDSAGNVYFATTLDVVFKLSRQGMLTRVAGTGARSTGFLGDNFLAVDAYLNEPTGLAVDGLGNVYISDFGNGRIRKVAPDGIITTIAGTGSRGISTGDGGPAVNAQLGSPVGLAVDVDNNLYLAEREAHRVRKISTNGIITAVAGTGVEGYSGDGGSAIAARLMWPNALAVDASGNLYIGDDSYRIRKVSGGIISTIAGNGTMGYTGDGGSATAAAIGAFAIALDFAGNLYVSDYQGHIRKITTGGTISTLAGDGRVGYYGDGGAATSATFYVPRGVAADAFGNVYIADGGNMRIRRVASGTVSTVAGGVTGDGGAGLQAAFASPTSIALDAAGNRYVADCWNHRVRKIAVDGAVTTVAGTGVMGAPLDGSLATAAALSFPCAVALDHAGNLLIADSGNFALRKVNAAGIISTVLAGRPTGFTLDASDNIYFLEDHRIYKLANGAITVFAGNGSSVFSGDNGPALDAGIAGPGNMTFDALGNLYLVDGDAYRIRKISTAGIITTIAGNGQTTSSGEGVPATSTGIPFARGLAFDAAGNLYINLLNSVRMVDTSGIIRTVAGGPYGYFGDGGPAVGAGFNSLQGIAVAPNGNIYLADSGNNAIRLLTPVGVRPVLTTTVWHNGVFIVGQAGKYFIQLANAANTAATSGDVTVRVSVANATLLYLFGAEGSGWNCSSNTCTRSEPLLPSYGAVLTMWVIAPSNPTQITNVVTVSGGGGEPSGASDLTVVSAAVARLRITKTHQGSFPKPGQGTYTLLVSNDPGGDAAQGTITVTEALPAGMTIAGMSGDGWTCPAGGVTCTHNVALAAGMSYAPLYVTVNTTAAMPATVINQVSVSGGNSPSASAADSTNLIQCGTGFNPLGRTIAGPGGSGSIAIRAVCLWNAISSAPWLAITSSSSGSADAIIQYAVAPNPGARRSAYITAGGLTFTVVQLAASGEPLRFVPVTSCRIADTRLAPGPFGGPNLAASMARDFNVAGSCGIPDNAVAYSLNLTVVPLGALGFLSVYPAGQGQPQVSTLNSGDGRIKANAAIVPAGVNGAITLFASNAAHAIIDVNGYFVPVSGNNDLQFYPVTPCRISDTRSGSPLGATITRNFPIAGSCGIPASAQAFALNMTVVPVGLLGFLSAWPAGQGQPNSSTLNAPTGAVTANAAIVPAGTAGAITVIATNATNLIIDVNGYFAPPGLGGMNFYTSTPCRIADTRIGTGAFGGPQLAAGTTRSFVVAASACGIPAAAGAFSLNATVAPPGPLGFLSMWGAGTQPVVSTLNAGDGSLVANAALVAASATGAVSVIASNATQLILDINGYFAQ